MKVSLRIYYLPNWVISFNIWTSLQHLTLLLSLIIRKDLTFYSFCFKQQIGGMNMNVSNLTLDEKTKDLMCHTILDVYFFNQQCVFVR